jgi:hypothetical protein
MFRGYEILTAIYRHLCGRIGTGIRILENIYDMILESERLSGVRESWKRNKLDSRLRVDAVRTVNFIWIFERCEIDLIDLG